MKEYDVVIVGAGAAGVGLGCMLLDVGIESLLIIDRKGVGASFESWPEEMMFLTPSFPTNSAGVRDTILSGNDNSSGDDCRLSSGSSFSLPGNSLNDWTGNFLEQNRSITCQTGNGSDFVCPGPGLGK